VTVGPAYAGRGLGLEIVQRLINHARKNSATQINAITANKFLRSILLKLGFETVCEWKLTEMPYADRLSEEFNQKFSDDFLRSYSLRLE